jgi:hypothetical protein
MTPLEKLLYFISSLRDAKIHFSLDSVREAIMVVIPTPASYYEVEFFADGHIESQTFGPASDVRDVFLDAITREVVQAVNGKGEHSS